MGLRKRIDEKHAMTSHPALRDSTRNVGEGNFRGGGKQSLGGRKENHKQWGGGVRC